MVERGKELGLAVAIVELLPWNNGHPDADLEIEELNRLIGRIGADEDVPVMPWHEALEDPEEPGTMRADLTIEGDHPSVAGYRILGTKAFVEHRRLRRRAGDVAERSPRGAIRGGFDVRRDCGVKSCEPRGAARLPPNDASSAGAALAALPACICGGHVPNQLSRPPSIVSVVPLKKSPAGEAR